MAYDPNMNRWIMASCRTWFENNKLNDIKIFYEYTKHKDIDDHTTKYEIQQYGEFRMDGPDYKQITKNEQWYDVIINVLVTQTLNEGNSDEVELLIGSIAVCFAECIPVFRYGSSDNILNDNTQIGVLKRVNQKSGEVNVARFGQANPDTQITQASIESNYRLKL